MNSLMENNNLLNSTQTAALDKMEVCNLPVNETNVNEIWTKTSFNSTKPELSLKLDNAKMSWSSCQKEDNNVMMNEEEVEEMAEEKFDVKEPSTPEHEVPTSPSHHARRPMNAFLIFCKKHRPIVRKKYPNLENRGVTRILGEWWAVLDANDKDAYTNLAKEYKDAFFSANPNFKWYKLPAPPLRTFPTRPTAIKHETTPPTSPTNAISITSEFTPGKLADETQLGMLSSLLTANNTYNNNKSSENDIKQEQKFADLTTLCNNNNQIDNNNKSDFESLFETAASNNQNNELPPKPIKKRFAECFLDNKMMHDDEKDDPDLNMTKQQIMNKVVDSQFIDDEEMMRNGFKDTRKSVRKCKGNRYAEFMANGKLIKNKRDKSILETPKLDLNNTIKRLEERIQPKNSNDEKTERTRTISEVSDTEEYSKTVPSFNLDQRISELPSLSYETYLQRKKENKKRKFVKKTESKPKIQMPIQKETGSKKRKNKHNITHLEKKEKIETNYEDLSGLATLAEIAAIKEKITST